MREKGISDPAIEKGKGPSGPIIFSLREVTFGAIFQF